MTDSMQAQLNAAHPSEPENAVTVTHAAPSLQRTCCCAVLLGFLAPNKQGTLCFVQLQADETHHSRPDDAAAGLHNMLAWRDANMPGVPIWVTEWGWDANRPGETCGKSTECVSQLAQAAYGIRGLSLLARKGVAQSHWFFYASE